ncbi:MAG: lysylphosphatidylglycerol synthase transmembrane domain-containing protein [Candidatus Caenarcaniphilales bacterium]|nr:lysylphosphatidylglycerol synthase transmembrane domain-containing protein [Candidatus Caenarcaniphilales bacterium]
MKLTQAKSLFSLFLKLGITAICLFFLYRDFKGELLAIPDILSQANWLMVGLAGFFLLASQIVAVWRWRVCAEALGIISSDHSPTTNLELGRIYFISLFANNFLPGAFGGDLIRALILKRENPHCSMVNCGSSVLLDRFCGLIILVWSGFLMCWYLKLGMRIDLPQSLYLGMSAIWLVFNLSLLIAIFLSHRMHLIPHIPFSTRLNHKLRECIALFAALTKNHERAWNMFLSSVVIQILVGFCLISLYQGLKLNFSPFFVWLLHPVTTLGTFILPSINGLGVRESLHAFLFTTLGYTAQAGITLSVGWFLLFMLVSLPGAALMLVKPAETFADLKQTPETSEHKSLAVI